MAIEFDQGAIIGYEPKLKYEKDKNSIVNNENSSSDTQKTDYSGQIIYSNAISSFEDNLPSKALSNLSDADIMLRTFVDELTKSFKNDDWGQYSQISSLVTALSSGNDEYARKFVNYHRYNIEGSIIPELIYTLFDADKRVNTLLSLTRALFYGNNDNDNREIDESYLKQLKMYEQAQETQKINYYALHTDATLCNIISSHSVGIRRSARKIYNVPSQIDESSTDYTNRDLILRLYNETNTDIDAQEKIFTDQQNIDLIENSLYNYYQKRKDTLDVYNLFSDNGNSRLLERKLRARQEETNRAIENVMRTLKAEEVYLAQNAELEQEKHFLMNINAKLATIS